MIGPHENCPFLSQSGLDPIFSAYCFLIAVVERGYWVCMDMHRDNNKGLWIHALCSRGMSVWCMGCRVDSWSTLGDYAVYIIEKKPNVPPRTPCRLKQLRDLKRQMNGQFVCFLCGMRWVGRRMVFLLFAPLRSANRSISLATGGVCKVFADPPPCLLPLKVFVDPPPKVFADPPKAQGVCKCFFDRNPVWGCISITKATKMVRGEDTANFDIDFQHFKAISDEEKSQIMANRNSKTTQDATRRTVTMLNQYILEKNLPTLDSTTDNNLPLLLENFYVALQKKKRRRLQSPITKVHQSSFEQTF